MEAEKNEVPNLFGQFKAYLNTRLKYIRYQAAIKGTALAADIVAELAVLFCYLLVFLFASFTLGAFLASLFESFWAGFGCLALIYLVMGIIIVVFKRRIERPIINAFLHKVIK